MVRIKKKIKSGKAIKFLQKHSSKLAFFSQSFFTFVYVFVLFQYLNSLNNTANLKEIAIFGTIALPVGVFIRQLSYNITRIAEFKIDRIHNFSFFNITKGDKELIEESNKKNKKSWNHFIINTASQLIIGIIVAGISKIIFS